jgi:hypothetical protein
MVCTCKNCGETVGKASARSSLGMMLHFAVPIWVGSIVWPIFEKLNQRILWEDFAQLFYLGLFLWCWLLFRFWFTSLYSWLWFTLLRKCSTCKKRCWGIGECHGWGL